MEKTTSHFSGKNVRAFKRVHREKYTKNTVFWRENVVIEKKNCAPEWCSVFS